VHPDNTPLNTDASSLVGTNVPHSSRPTACLHPTHRTVRLFMAYAEANSVRSRLAEAVSLTGITVSGLLRIDGGWIFNSCQRCLPRHGSERQSA
jgi:hypothetical protein